MSEKSASVRRRVRHELVRFWVISAYLYVCFGAIILYKAAILRGHGFEYETGGGAAIQALIVAKFIMLGEAVGIGERYQRRSLVFVVLAKAVLLLLLLMALSAIEQVVEGLIDGRTAIVSLRGLWGGTLLQVFATSFLMLLILIPYIGFGEFARVLGPERLRAVLLESGTPP